MRVKNFKNYSKVYESKLMECEFFTESNIEAGDIISPIEDLINEEFIDKLIDRAKNSRIGKAVGDVYTNVKDAISKVFNGVVNFFKNFSLKKMFNAVYGKIKEIGSKMFTKIKRMLGGMKSFILSNNLATEDNKPIFKNIWSVLCQKAKGVIKGEGVDQELGDAQLAGIGDKVKINEADSSLRSKSIGDDEVKYYGMFEKIAHAMGIRNARFNGVVSQIMKKGAIGLAIMGLLKLAGFSFAFSLGLGPVATAVIGGMLLMAGLIILAIWVCKPYPTLEDCLAYLKLAFTGNLVQHGMTNIFITDIDIVVSQNTTIVQVINGGGGSSSSSSSSSSSGSKSGKDTNDTKDAAKDDTKGGEADGKKTGASTSAGSYSAMIKNLKALQGIVTSYRGVSLEGQGGSQEEKEYAARSQKYKDKKERERLAADRRREKGNKRFQNLKDRESAIGSEVLDSVMHHLLGFHELFEREFSKGPRNIMVGKEDEYSTEALGKLRTSIKSFVDEGIKVDSDMIQSVLDARTEKSTKENIKKLYDFVLERIQSRQALAQEMDDLYTDKKKKALSFVDDESKREVVGEKIAKLYKRTRQLEQAEEDLYGSMGELGEHLKDFNVSMQEVVKSLQEG